MKNFLILLCLLVSLAGGALAQSAAPAPAKIGVIQIQAAMVSTKEGQAAAAELENKMSPKRKDLEKKQTDLRDLQEKLQRGGNTLSQTAKDDLTRQIDQRTKSINREMEDAQADLDAEQQRVVGELSQKMQVVIDKYAQDNSYAIILDVSNPNTPVLYASNTVDITKDIIELYDKMQPSLPAGSAAPAKPAAVKPAAPAAVKPPAAAPPKPAPPK